MNQYVDEVEKLLADDSFIAWIEGRAAKEEAYRWEAWSGDDPTRKQLVKQATALHQDIAFNTSQHSDVEAELARLNKKVDKFEGSGQSAKGANIFQINRKKFYLSAAAVMVLLLTVVSVAVLLQADFYTSDTKSPQFVTESTHNGQQKQLTLSDGSTIVLNANSSLRYPSKYSGGDLEVWLEGEAYFDIVHTTGLNKRSFSVNVSGGKVNVRGTKFNINTYEESTEVVLVQGRVNVEMQDSSRKIKDSHIMEPGEICRISRANSQIQTAKIKSDIYTAWTEDQLVFDHTPLAKVAQRVEHIYGVQFHLDGYQLEKRMISGSLPNDNLSVFLNTLEKMIDCPLKIDGDQIVPERQNPNVN